MASDVDLSAPAAPAPAAGDPLGRAEDTLEAVAAALGRLDDGSYGRCARCGADLGDEALAADPTATACATHA